MDGDTSEGASPFFLPGRAGNLFTLYHRPAGPAGCRGGVLYVHPFANEMNYTRRAAALLARALAGRGWGVLQVDLFGCGDSDGDFRDASWETWVDDLTTAFDWLQERVGGRVGLVGIRLGGLLALDFASRARRNIDRVLLWHPVVNGQEMMTDFLRLKILSDAMGVRGGQPATTRELRKRVYSGEPVEVLGYEIMPTLGQAIAAIHIAPLGLTVANPIRWIEVVSTAEDPGRAVAQSTVLAWQAARREATLHLVNGRPFWSSPRIHDSRDMIETVAQIFGENRGCGWLS
jgi:exosortase A-associated hydrolase 2